MRGHAHAVFLLRKRVQKAQCCRRPRRGSFLLFEITCANIEAAVFCTQVICFGDLPVLWKALCVGPATGSISGGVVGNRGHNSLVSCLSVPPPLHEGYARPAPDMQRSGSGHGAGT